MELIFEFLDGNTALKYLFSINVSKKVSPKMSMIIKALYCAVGLIAFIALITGAILLGTYRNDSDIHTVGLVLAIVGGGYIVITLLIRGLFEISNSIQINKKEQRRL